MAQAREAAAAIERDAGTQHQRVKPAGGPIDRTTEAPSPAIDAALLAAMRDRSGRGGR